MLTVSFTRHAVKRYKETSLALGLPSSPEKMQALFFRAKPEKAIPKTRFELLKRSVLHGSKETYLVYDGWRFVVVNNVVVTIERVKPHENGKYYRNFGGKYAKKKA